MDWKWSLTIYFWYIRMDVTKNNYKIEFTINYSVTKVPTVHVNLFNSHLLGYNVKI